MQQCHFIMFTDLLKGIKAKIAAKLRSKRLAVLHRSDPQPAKDAETSHPESLGNRVAQPSEAESEQKQEFQRIKDFQIWFSLSIAIEDGDIQEIRRLVELGAPLFRKSSAIAELRFIHSYKKCRCLAVTECLVELGALLEAPDGGWSAVCKAAERSHHEVVCYLIKQGAFFPSEEALPDGQWPFLGNVLVTAAAKSPEMLLARGIRIDALGVMRAVLDMRSPQHWQNATAATPLSIAFFRSQSARAFKTLVRVGARLSCTMAGYTYDVKKGMIRAAQNDRPATSTGAGYQSWKQYANDIAKFLVETGECDLRSLAEDPLVRAGIRDPVIQWVTARADKLPRALLAGHPSMLKPLADTIREYLIA